MTFARPESLWLLWLAPVAGLAAIWFWHRQLRAVAAWAATPLWPRLELNYRRRRLIVAVVSLVIALLGVALALARPRWGIVEQMVERRGVDIVFLLDSSLSMQARDVAPSRLDIAKVLIRRLVAALPGHRAALVQAEGKGLVMSPLTVDTAVIDLLLDTVFPASLPDPGTRLESALDEALDLFPPEGEKHRVVVVASDGEDHGSAWQQSLNRLVDAGVVVHVLGIGTRDGTPIQIDSEGGARYKLDAEGSVVVSRLNPELLEQLAQSSGGLFLEVASAAVDPAPLVRAINAMEKRALSGEILDVAAERFQWPLAIAAVALILHLALPVLVARHRPGDATR